MNKLLSLAFLLAAACGTSLPVASRIERERVLGAHVSVDAEPQRAWPRPGEAATIRWITAAPDGAADLSWMLAACAAATSSGPPLCTAAPFASASGTGTPTLPFTTPSDIAADSVVVFGAVCATGTPVLTEDGTATCDDGSRVELIARHVFVAFDEANYNPSLADADLTVDGRAWADAGCVTAGAAKLLLGATLDDGDRESFVTTDGAQEREHLELSVFATAGDLLEPKAYVDPDDTRSRASVAVEWLPPEADDLDGDREQVTFTFLVSDLRGGVDSTTRTLCITR